MLIYTGEKRQRCPLCGSDDPADRRPFCPSQPDRCEGPGCEQCEHFFHGNDIPPDLQPVTGEQRMTNKQILALIDEFCQMGLNSENPKHWEAALDDILSLVRRKRAA